MSEKIKILLINPPFHRLFGETKNWFPLGLYYLRGFLNTFSDMNVEVYNADNSATDGKNKFLTYKERYVNSKEYVIDNYPEVWEEIRKKVKEVNPQIIGICSFSEGFASAIKISRIVKKYFKESKVILGGPHTQYVNNKNTIEKYGFDHYIRGEGEIKWLRYIIHLYPDFRENIEEILSRQYGSSLKDNFIRNLDSLPFPFQKSDVKNAGIDKLPLLLGRGGCPYNCGFCACSRALEEAVFRRRTVKNIIEEIKTNKRELSISKYFIVDDTFSYSRKDVVSLCEELCKLDFEVSWSCTTRVNAIDDELVTLMKKAGCHSIHIGVETGSEKMLLKVHKGITLEDVVEKSEMIKEHGIKVKAFFMLGFPDETESDIKATCEFIKKLDADETMLHVYIPYPDTDLYDEILKKIEYFRMDWEHFKRYDLESYRFMVLEGCRNIEDFRRLLEEKFDFIEELENGKK